jgi:hypothetical protein
MVRNASMKVSPSQVVNSKAIVARRTEAAGLVGEHA